MKNRWISAAALATLLALGACAPQQGTDASVPATPAASSHDGHGASASASAEASAEASAGASASAEPTPEDYEY
jgi:hypothetical protein